MSGFEASFRTVYEDQAVLAKVYLQCRTLRRRYVHSSTWRLAHLPALSLRACRWVRRLERTLNALQSREGRT